MADTQTTSKWVDLAERAVMKLGVPLVILGLFMAYHWYSTQQWRADLKEARGETKAAIKLCLDQSRKEHQETRREVKAETKKVVETVTHPAGD